MRVPFSLYIRKHLQVISIDLASIPRVSDDTIAVDLFNYIEAWFIRLFLIVCLFYCNAWQAIHLAILKFTECFFPLKRQRFRLINFAFLNLFPNLSHC